MKYPIFASFIVFLLVIGRAIRKNNRIQEKNEQSFWDRERKANSTRRQSLEHLNYIHIPFDTLPTNLLLENEQVQDCIETLHTLSEQKIVNLTGFSNTELKLEYGAANIALLSEYDQNYTLLVCTLQKWAELLYQSDLLTETKTVLEFAVSTHTDIGKTYYLLAKLYAQEGNTTAIQDLITTAASLSSLSSKTIVRTLKESYPHND